MRDEDKMYDETRESIFCRGEICLYIYFDNELKIDKHSKFLPHIHSLFTDILI